MKVNFYLFIHSISHYKKSLSTLFLLFWASLLWGQTFINFNPGPNSWNAPANVTSVTVEVWGGGGAGRPVNAQNAGGGGGSGGGYVKATYPVTSGNNYTYTVGLGGAGNSGGNGGDTFFVNASTIKAVGGNGAGNATNGWSTGANAPSSGNLVGGGAVQINSAYGGKGGDASSKDRDSGGGGSSAGDGNNNGNDADLIIAGAAPTNGYAGGQGIGNGESQGVNGGIGAGGGGARRGNNGSGFLNGGNGGDGQLRITYISVSAVSPSSVCNGSTITITGTNFSTSGTTTVSINGTACTGVTVVNNTTITAVVAPGTTTGKVVVNNPNGSNNAQSITVNPSPAAISGGASTVCVGSTTPAFTNSVGGGTWSITNGTGSATITTGGVVTGVSAGNVTVVYTLGSCSSTQTLTVSSPPAAIGGGATAVCVGANTPAFTNSVGGGTWSIINGTGSASITAGGVVTGLTAGNVTVVYTVGSCPAVTRSLTINATPSAIGGGSSTVCVGSTTPAFTNSVGGGTWSITNGTGSATITAGGVVTGVSAGTATVVYTIGTCAVSVPITVIAASAIITNPNNVNVVAGANATFTVSASNTPTTYTWQVSTDGGVSWATVTNGGVYSNATTATLNITGATFGMNGYLYRASASNACGASVYSSHAKLTVAYCTPTFSSSNVGKLYIKSFKFIGVLNDDLQVANVSTQSETNGVYENFTNLTPTAEQVRGSVVNIEAICNGTITSSSGIVGWGYWMAWVDWNRDGTFDDATERVYALQGYLTKSVTFGFIIPNDKLGDYRIRIATMSDKSTNPCGFSSAYGEVEDYLFRVVEDNQAKLDTSKPNLFSRCGNGEIALQVYGADTNAKGFNWYSAKYGGTPLYSGNVYNAFITDTTTYYVAVVDGNGKETPFRYPIVARKDPVPVVYFTPTPETICGEDDPSLLLNVWGDNREVVLFDEKFNSGLGVFDTPENIQKEDTKVLDGSVFNGYTYVWKTVASPLEQKNPPHLAIASSVSSGYFGGNFAIMNSDGADRLKFGGVDTKGINIKRHLITKDSYNTMAFLPNQLYLDFDLYYFSIGLIKDDARLNVEYSLDGTTWKVIKTFVLNHGNPLFWEKVSLNLDDGSLSTHFPKPAYNIEETPWIPDPTKPNDIDSTKIPKVERSANIKFRFSLFSRGLPSGYFENVATLDNVKLWGSIPVDRDYEWSGIDAGVLYDKTCTTPLGTTWARTVCVKPPIDEFEKPYWDLYASATFQSGCPAIGSTRVYNDTKIWNQPGKTDWNQANDWKPVGVSDIKKCVIARTPVELPSGTTGTHGLARSVIVKSGGTLTISPKSSLTIQNYIKNEVAAADVIVDNDANLVQNNNSAVNIGNITVKRSANLKRLDYNLWGSPVAGQNVKAFSPGTLDTRFYVYNESNDYFDGLFIRNLYPDNVTYSLTPTVDKNTYTFIKGKGYGIRASNTLSSTTSAQMHSFIGVPNNGIVDIALLKSATGGGYNLISNPYPSNIDFYALYNYGTNSSMIYNTAYFWTNTNFNPKMQGSNYPSNVGTTTIINNYAVLNGTGGLGAPYGFNGTGVNTPVSIVPTSVIKPGQGFIVKAKTNGNLRIENGSNIRTNDANSTFFNRMASHRTAADIKDRFWVSLKTPLDFVTPLLIGYLKGATNNFEEDYDAELFVHGGDSFYSLLEDKKLAIQGRSPFNVHDKISLGATFGLQGQYEIFIENKEGVFASQQPIYLKDNLTGQITNLSQEKYVFTANAGDTTNRFEIQYTNEGTLNTSDLKNQSTVVYQVQNDIIIESPSVIKGLKVYDASGKLVHQSIEKEKKVTVSSIHYSKGVYVIEIVTEIGKEVKKIVK